MPSIYDDRDSEFYTYQIAPKAQQIFVATRLSMARKLDYYLNNVHKSSHAQSAPELSILIIILQRSVSL